MWWTAGYLQRYMNVGRGQKWVRERSARSCFYYWDFRLALLSVRFGAPGEDKEDESWS